MVAARSDGNGGDGPSPPSSTAAPLVRATPAAQQQGTQQRGTQQASVACREALLRLWGLFERAIAAESPLPAEAKQAMCTRYLQCAHDYSDDIGHLQRLTDRLRQRGAAGTSPSSAAVQPDAAMSAGPAAGTAGGMASGDAASFQQYPPSAYPTDFSYASPYPYYPQQQQQQQHYPHYPYYQYYPSH